jgi:DNA polymerase elongation subunit (family B)
MEFPRKEAPELDTSSSIKFQIVDWYIPEADKNREKPEITDEPDLYNIIIYGTTETGHTVSLRIEDYQPYFYVKPPESWQDYSAKVFSAELSKLKLNLLEGTYLCTVKRDGIEKQYNKRIITPQYEKHLVDVSKVIKKDFWGFTNNKDFKYIKVQVKSLTLYNQLKYYFQTLKKKGFVLYESNIDPFLRYIHELNIKPCGWVSVNEYTEEIDDKYDTRCYYNIVTNYKNIEAVDKNSIAPLLIASFDIECTSSHGDFPVARKDYRKVAQDLANVAKAGYEITPELLLYWLENIYIKDIVIEDNLKIHRVYAKSAVNFPTFKEQLSNNLKTIIDILNEISNISQNTDDTDDEETIHKPITLKEQNTLEAKINSILTTILPSLNGDKIIQIGTTVHKYGSDQIIYKNIISLNTCDSITNADVVECKNEAQLILEWKTLISNLNPDILIGYNIFGFDMEYIWVRAQENSILDKFARGLGRNLKRNSTLVRQELSSSALGENILKYFDMDGTVIIDIFKVMQREHKLDSYKLDNVASIFLGDHKDDLKPHEIFQKFEGNSTDRCVIAKYCIQDCVLLNRLLHKLKILENNIGMGNVCLVPLNYLFKRGQGIKIFSLIAKQCMDKGYLIPVIRNFSEIQDIQDDGYEGAVVLEPKEGIYLNDPIVVFDYGSLYPSSMIARNLSHDCYVMDDKYKVDDPNVDYITVSYDIYEGTGDKKKKTGVKECTFAQYKDGKKGIIADILCMLLQERKNTRKKMEYQTIITTNKQYIGLVSDKDDKYEIINIDTNIKTIIDKQEVLQITDTYNKFEQDVFDALQLAYKITANSLYGQIGARTSPIYLKDIAACTTATGREMIMIAKEFVETNYNAEVIYGDSVMPYTPITYKTDEQILVSTFEDIYKDGYWLPYENFKPDDLDRYEKEQYIPNNIKVWTHKGWAKVNRIIRHKTTKKIYRVATLSGVVDVTEDHSLLDASANIIKPKDCTVGQILLHSQPSFECYNRDLDVYQAYIYGMFVGNGKMYVHNGDYSSRYLWKIAHPSITVLRKCKKYLESIESISFIISYENNEYILTTNPEGDIMQNFMNKYKICYDSSGKYKIVPNIILNSNWMGMLEFKEGLDDANGGKFKYVIDINHQITAQSYIVLFQMLMFSVKILYHINHTNMSIILTSNIERTANAQKIYDIEVLHDKYYGYVYDIETEEGVFHGGIGNMILKNTDSIFCKFPLKDGEGNTVQGKQALQYAIEIGKHVEKNIVSRLPQPQKLNYEKSLYPFILFSKKRYVGNLYETDVNKCKQKSMGIVLKRRDNAPIVKKIYGGIIDILLNKQDLHASIEFLRAELTDLVAGKTCINELIISKSLRATYKDASKIPHKVLADRMGERDAGNKPQVNDRIPFVYIKVPNAKLQADRIENPEYIVQNQLTPDYLHYITNQIMNPILQLYALCLEELPNYDKSVSYWKEVEEELKQKPLYQDDIKRKNRLANLRLNAVKEYLFDEFIYMLCEPKTKRKSKGIITTGDNIVTEKKTRKKKEDTNTTNVIINELDADIKITKKKESKKIEAIAKITIPKTRTSIWQYKNEDCKDKMREIINIITDMLVEAKKQNKILNIKVNYKQFVTDYKNSLLHYSEFEKNADGDDNLVRNAIKYGDIGTIKATQAIMLFEQLIISRQYIKMV